jgi:hypothetical protein
LHDFLTFARSSPLFAIEPAPSRASIFEGKCPVILMEIIDEHAPHLMAFLIDKAV